MWYKILCVFGFHKKIITFDGMTNGKAQVCLRLNCKWKKVMKIKKVETK